MKWIASWYDSYMYYVVTTIPLRLALLFLRRFDDAACIVWKVPVYWMSLCVSCAPNHLRLFIVLETIINQLLEIARNDKYSPDVLHFAYKFLYIVTKVKFIQIANFIFRKHHTITCIVPHLNITEGMLYLPVHRPFILHWVSAVRNASQTIGRLQDLLIPVLSCAREVGSPAKTTWVYLCWNDGLNDGIRPIHFLSPSCFFLRLIIHVFLWLKCSWICRCAATK